MPFQYSSTLPHCTRAAPEAHVRHGVFDARELRRHGREVRRDLSGPPGYRLREEVPTTLSSQECFYTFYRVSSVFTRFL